MNKHKFLIAVVGPTAIGKTALSIKLANHYNAEIISADSRQFYKEMRIGTATPTDNELSQAKHHFIHHISIHEDYNVGSFEKDAIRCLSTLFEKHDVVIMVGGSGLYIDAVTKGLDDFPEIDPSIRETLNDRLKKEGMAALQKELKQLDKETYKSIAINNPHRVIRALEVCIGSQLRYSSFLNKSKVKRPFKTIYVGIDAERETIYDRINQRVDLMIDSGLIEEVESLLPFKDLNALNTVGYKELFNFLEKQWTLEFAISEIKKNTRRFAKRQLTWFRKNNAIKWFDYKIDVNSIIKTINQEIKKPVN